MITDKYIIRNIRDDAKIAIDSLNSIVAESENDFVSERYISEKINRALDCCSFILSTVEEDSDRN